jgi:hypothetical protein
MQGKREEWIKVNLANQYGLVTDGKPVHPEYRDDVHCRDFELIPGLPIYIGLDFGLTPAATFAQRTVMGQWRLSHELVTTDTGVIRFANLLKKFINENFSGYQIAKITGDPAGDQRQAGDSEERTVFQLLEANDIKATPADTNDFARRTESLNEPLRRMIDGQPGFIIHSRARVTRKGLQGGYKFRRLKVAGEERYEDKPVKSAESHPVESAHYLCMGGGESTAMLQGNSKEAAADAAEYRKKRGLST